MSIVPDGNNGSSRILFGVFPVDLNGTVGDLVGMWHRSLPEAEQHLKRVKDHQGENYITLSSTDYEKHVHEQRAAGLVFKTGHDLLMDEFDQWLKDNDLVRGATMAAKLGFTDKGFKSFVKKNLIKSTSMPDHDNLIGYPADFTLTTEQHRQFLNERSLNAHHVAEELGLTPKEFGEVKRRANIAHSDEILGRTIPNDSSTYPLYSRADIEKLRPVAAEVKARGIKPAVKS